MNEKIIYLDNNATTKTCDKAMEAMMPFLTEKYGNPSSIHSFGGQTGKYIKTAREQVSALIGAANPNEIIFTSCGTESSNMALKGIDYNYKKHLITTKVEHPCVLNIAKHFEKNRHETTYLGVNSEGEIDIDEFKDSIRDDTALIAVMWANNETGVIFPVEQMAEIAKEKNPDVLFFVDAVQVAGKIPIDVKNTKIDMLSISGHKIHAPKGIGALYIRKGTLLTPLMMGGHQERGKRSGTENVAGIVALGAASEEALDYVNSEIASAKRECRKSLKGGFAGLEGFCATHSNVKQMRDKLEKGILEKVFNAKVNGSRLNRVPNTTNISFEYIEGELILLHLNDLNICASSGSACSSGTLEPSHVLRAMGIPFTSVHGSIRFSLSKYTSDDEIDYVLKNLPGIINKINSISPFQKELKELEEIKTALKG